MQITPHFSLEELTRTDTGLDNDPGMALAGNMARLANTLEEVNRRVGGVRTSAHLFGRAADFVPVGMGIEEAFESIKKSGIVWDQLILEPTWIHLGISCAREKPRQQCLIATMQGGKMAYSIA